MNQRPVLEVRQHTGGTSLAAVSEALDGLVKHPIAQVPWPAYAYKPTVSFAIAHHHDHLFIKFWVIEDDFETVYRHTNDPVYRDTCVEFFISFNQAPAYYNFEFNKLGTCRAGFGPTNNQRQLLPEQVIGSIEIMVRVEKVPGPESQPVVKWELILGLPAAAFCFHAFTVISQQQCRVNFYKCGDDLPKPHFLAWNNIIHPTPNFHLPEFFGEIKFL